MFIYYLNLLISLSLTPETSNEIINNTKRLPIFVEIWDPWCPHCKAFSKSWEGLSNLTEFEDKLIFSDINCFEFKDFCKIFPGKETPRFFWIDNNISLPRQYSGIYTEVSIFQFIKKQLTAPFVLILDFSNISQIVKKSPDLSFFVFNISKNDQKSLNIASEIVTALRHLPCTFLLFIDIKNHYPFLYTFTTLKIINHFKGNWTHSDLSLFIKHRSIPFFSHFTEQTQFYVEIHKLPIAIFIKPEMGYHPKITEIGKSVHEYILTTQTTCSLNPWVCQYTGMKSGINGSLIILDRKNKKFWTLKTLTTPERAKKWTIAVLNGYIKSYGPGTGILSYFLNVWYESRGIGGLRYYILFIPFIVLSITFLIILYIPFERFLMKNFPCKCKID